MVIDHLISISKSPVYLSNKVMPSKKVTDAVDIETVYWDKNKRDQQIATLPEGCYAYFIFNGGWSDYIQYINNIYMNTLAFYGLQKKGDYDIEVISQGDNGDYIFEYYIPVTPLINNSEKYAIS
ncbi:GyrI-like domain-containing protein [Escherichia coli]